MGRLIKVGRHYCPHGGPDERVHPGRSDRHPRFGDASIAAHQIAFQLWLFLALVLDAIAIAGQVLLGRGLGAGDTERAYEAGARMIWLAVYAGAAFAAVLLALGGVLPYAFTWATSRSSSGTQAIWPLFNGCSR